MDPSRRGEERLFGVNYFCRSTTIILAGALASLAVTPEAPGQLDSLQYRQIQIADLLEQLRGRGPGKRFRQRVPPLPVLFLQLQERLHRVVPLLWPRSPVRWPTVPDPGFAGLAPLPVTCLPLRVRQRHTTMLHRYVTDRGEAVGRAIEAQAWRQSHRSVVIGIGVRVRVGPRQRARGSVPGVARALSGPVSRVGSEPDVGVGHARPEYPRETERPGWAGRCGRLRRTGKGVPSSDNSSAAEGSSGARGDRGDDRWRLLRQASLEAALSRARTTSGWALTLGRARILRFAPQRRGNWQNAADAFGRQPADRRQNRQFADVSDYTGFRKQRVGGAAATADPVAVHETPAVETVTARAVSTGPFDSSCQPENPVSGGDRRQFVAFWA